MNHDKSKKHHGVVVPMITPLTPSFDLDEDAVGGLIEHAVGGGVHGIFVLGTTGEASSLPQNVRTRFVEQAVKIVGDRATVYAGVADNCLADAVNSATEYVGLGAGAIVVRLPSYYPLSDSEQLDFLSTFVQEVPAEILIYNMPSLTKMSISIDTVDRLSCHPRVVGVKDSTFDAAHLHRLIDVLGGRSDFSVFTGPASMSAQMIKSGADGIIPAFSNLQPGLCAELYHAASTGDDRRAVELQEKLDALGRICRGYPAPSSLKCAMSVLGLCSPTVMTPLQTLSLDDQRVIQRRMAEMDLLPEQIAFRPTTVAGAVE